MATNGYSILVQNPTKGNDSDELSVDRRILLNGFYRNGGPVWTGFIWLMIGKSGRALVYVIYTFRFHKSFHSNMLDVQYFGFRTLKITLCNLQLLTFANMELLIQYFLTITVNSEQNISQDQIYIAQNRVQCTNNLLILSRNLFILFLE
jgi:hypothetical protein